MRTIEKNKIEEKGKEPRGAPGHKDPLRWRTRFRSSWKESKWDAVWAFVWVEARASRTALEWGVGKAPVLAQETEEGKVVASVEVMGAAKEDG